MLTLQVKLALQFDSEFHLGEKVSNLHLGDIKTKKA